MASEKTFDRLTRTLTASERAELLKRVQGLAALAEQAVGDGEDGEEAPDSGPGLLRLGLLERLVIFFVSLFTGKPRVDVIRDLAVKRLGEEVLRAAPGLFDPRRSVFLKRMRDELDALRASTAVFRDATRAAFGEEHDEFLAFLVGHLLPHVQDRLGASVDLSGSGDEPGSVETAEVRRRVHEDLENALLSIPEHERRGAYAEVRALRSLRRFAALPFDEILGTFDEGGPVDECPFARLKKHLGALDSHVHAVHRPPSPAALEGLFMFAHREEIGVEGFDLAERLTQELEQATQSLGVVHSFAERVPLTKVVRFSTENLEYVPRALGGGEDWFILFKRYWTSRAEETLREFARSVEQKRLVQEAESYLGVHRLPRLGTDGMTGLALEAVREQETALSLVLGFSLEIFYKLSRPFSTILERARFVKEDNRRELGQVYTYLNEVDSRLDALLGTLRSDEELMQPPQDAEVRRALASRARKAVGNLLDECASSIKLLSSILEGILRGSPGNRYDTVFNLDAVGDWQGKMMSEVLEEAYDRVTDGLSLLGRIRNL